MRRFIWWSAAITTAQLICLGGCSPPPNQQPLEPTKTKLINEQEITASRKLGKLDVTLAHPELERAVLCGTCHSTPPAWPPKLDPAELKEFHTQMRFEHGNNSCASCHDMAQRDLLKLADGTKLPFEKTLALCSQCHGSQAKDYAHGAHGGLNGTWDPKYGPRTRNHCTNCHDPHAPAYPKVMPAPPPKDRFLTPTAHH